MMDSNMILNRGTEITVIVFGGKRRRLRVWEDAGEGVWVCREEEYQRAISEQGEANCSGFPKEYVVEVHDTESVEPTRAECTYVS